METKPSKRAIIRVVVGVAAIILLFISQFLPGPAFMYLIVQMAYTLLQIFAVLAVVPLAVWTLIELILFFTRKKKVNEKVVIFFLSSCIIIVLFTQLNFFLNIARNRAIHRAEPIITAVENYKDTNGAYPTNLEELTPSYITKIPSTGIMGIRRFGYELKEDTYEIYFSQNTIFFFNFEVTVYNPKDQQRAEGSKLSKMYDTKFDHWKYYAFD